MNNEVQGEINRIYAQHPVGSEGYKSAAVQERLSGLFARQSVTPDAPEVASEPVIARPAAVDVEAENAARVELAQSAVAHIDTAIDPQFRDILGIENEAGLALGDDPDLIAVAEDFGSRLEGRFEDWDQTARPPDVPAETVKHAVTVLKGQEGGAELLAELGGASSPQMSESIGYMVAAAQHLSAQYPDLLARLMSPDPDAPDRLVADRPAIIRTATQYGRMLVHSQRARGAKGEMAMQNVESLKRELEKIYEDSPPGSEGYKKPSVQRRVKEINAALHKGPIVGNAGRTV